MKYVPIANLMKSQRRLPEDCIIVLRSENGLLDLAVHRESKNGGHIERTDFRISGVSPEDIQENKNDNNQPHVGWIEGKQIPFTYQWVL